jgi:hypothetical protein
MTDDIIAKNANEIWGTHNWKIFGAQAIIGVVALSIMECTLTTKLVITILGDLE